MKKIAVIQLKQIGDVLITSSLFKSLKRLYPESQLDYIVYDYAVGVVEENPYIDNLIIVDSSERKNPLKLYYRFFKLRKEKYDYSIDVLGDVVSAFITFFLGAKNRIVNRKEKSRNKIFYNNRIENLQKNVCNYRNFMLDGIETGNFEKIKNEIEVQIFLKNEEIDKVKDTMLLNGVDFSKPVAALGINSRREYKKWDLDYFVKLIDYLIEKYDMQIILYNSPSEKKFSELAKSKILKQQNVFTDIYTENIKELACLLKSCDIFIGNEGGPRHIAESVGTYTFSVAYITHMEEDWILNQKNWGYYNRMIQIDDYSKLSQEEFLEYKNQIKRDREKEIVEFKKLKPEFVIENLEKMLKELRKNNEFRSDIQWNKLK